ncbi:DNA polymerase-3 subunit beta [Dysgonomonas alginatilytica]|uniref:Beta sliding clamp n=1 Tax=Dysgonomonas alginatilytica TaxID=1605892 RepID=A0A2V3PP93_9BACT|nr:DNA polymerase III subunit beta [Dysgonomonas alginatilytica]PXV62626.1 DNA polymerase-3 subunit beta [Dysgonomonas alginatilytica]
MTTTINISKSELSSRLISVSKIITPKPALPIMSCFLFKVENRVLHISAADHSGRINTTIDNVTTEDEISICFEAKILLDALSSLPEQPIEFLINENLNTTIKYNGGKFELMGKSSEEFPVENNIPDATSLSIPVVTFLDGINKTSFCVADDDLRPVMNGIYIELVDNTINYVASDGHKLALATYEFPFTRSHSFILPSKIASILRKVISHKEETIDLLIGSNNVRFAFGTYIIVARLIEGNYPNYRSVIPQNNDKILTIGTSALKSALSRVMVFSNQSSNLVKFELSNDRIELSAQDIDFSTAANETVTCEYNNDSMAIGFKGHFLTELISAIPSSDLQMSFSDQSKATLITPVDDKSTDKLTYLLMPMMLND